MHMDLDTNMKMAGKRYPSYASYKVRPQAHVSHLCCCPQVGSTREGILNAVEIILYEDSGHTNNDSCVMSPALFSLDNS